MLDLCLVVSNRYLLLTLEHYMLKVRWGFTGAGRPDAAKALFGVTVPEQILQNLGKQGTSV